MLGDAQQFVDKFYDLYPNRAILLLIKAGSHIFDLNTPNSDQDFRGIYLPSPQEYYEGETRRQTIDWKTQPNQKGIKNSCGDIDFTLFSLNKFFDLLKNGDFNVMEMLHSPEDKILINSSYMKYLMDIRKNLLVNDISAFLGFVKKEYRRYGVNIYHYKIQEDFLNFLSEFDKNTRLCDIWDRFKEYATSNPQIIFTMSETGTHNLVPSVKIAQRLYQNTITVDYLRHSLQETLNRYGHRQKDMARDGVEFKGLYHALRLIYEANDLYDYGEFIFPFDKDRHDTLLKIKTSNIQQDVLFNMIDEELDKLYAREQTTFSNKPEVGNRIDKLIFSIEGQMKIKYIMEKVNGKEISTRND